MGDFPMIQGALHEDSRGKLSFFNSFDLSEIKRMYQIEPVNEAIIRAWQGHKVEKKWFYCIQGSFIINVVPITNFEHPVKDVKVRQYLIKENNPKIVHVAGGYATGIKAIVPNSKLLVFSNFYTEASKNDDYRFEPNFWNAQWEVARASLDL